MWYYYSLIGKSTTTFFKDILNLNFAEILSINNFKTFLLTRQKLQFNLTDFIKTNLLIFKLR